jgi:hypothetical protein
VWKVLLPFAEMQLVSRDVGSGRYVNITSAVYVNTFTKGSTDVRDGGYVNIVNSE